MPADVCLAFCRTSGGWWPAENWKPCARLTPWLGNSVYNNIIKASDLTAGSNYHFFKTGVQPMWGGLWSSTSVLAGCSSAFPEDPANAKGGKWTLNVPRTRKSELDLFWLYTMLGLIGETLEDSDEITGAVVSVRARADRIAIWTKTAGGLLRLGRFPAIKLITGSPTGDKEVQEKIARAWKAELSLDDNEMLGYLPHSEASSKAPKDAYTV